VWWSHRERLIEGLPEVHVSALPFQIRNQLMLQGTELFFASFETGLVPDSFMACAQVLKHQIDGFAFRIEFHGSPWD